MNIVLWGFDFGHRGPEPGLCNEEIAREVGEWVASGFRKFNTILSQDGNGEGTRGLGTALCRFGVQPYFEVGVSKQGPTHYLGTREVVEHFLGAWPLKNGDIVWVACHQTAWTGTRTLAQSVLRERGLKVKFERLPMVRIQYDPQSHQFQARGLIRCWAYKFWKLGVYILRGEIFSHRGKS